MKRLNEKLELLKNNIKNRKVRIMIIGLGSVGSYLLDYLLSYGDEDMEIFVAGRNREKIICNINIIKVASLIRRQNRSNITIISDVDLNDINSIKTCLENYNPDIIVNSSRAYTGLKYGSISWKNIRAYGIWTPLAIKYIKNILYAYEETISNAIVINTSYSDAVIPWMKSAGMDFPDFGSGNINHLIPRIKFALSEMFGIKDYWNIDITYAVSHFHDVVISKEGSLENVTQMIETRYKGEHLKPDMDRLFKMCMIPMPVDAKRNMMNASSDFEIIKAVLEAVRNGKSTKLHCPGVFGEIGGYPVIVDGSGDNVKSYIYEKYFTLEEMREKNRESIYLDGIKDIKEGTLYYTNELVKKTKKAFGVTLPKTVQFCEIEEVAGFIIKEIIRKNM